MAVQKVSCNSFFLRIHDIFLLDWDPSQFILVHGGCQIEIFFNEGRVYKKRCLASMKMEPSHYIFSLVFLLSVKWLVAAAASWCLEMKCLGEMIDFSNCLGTIYSK